MSEPSTTEQLIDVNGVQLCIETFGDPTHPAVLLVHGACASMLWWDRELCEQIATHGRFVIRYDNRDTGRSVRYPPGRPGYTLTDMARDAIGILDVLAVPRAHIVGRSMAGAIALIAGVDHPDRVASLTFVGTTPGDDGLPPMSDAVLARSSGTPDFTDPAAVVDYGVELMRAYVGKSPFFDEDAVRALAQRDVARTGNMASAFTNHFAIDFDGPVSGGFGDIVAPTLVVHGDVDPVFPLPHAEALCAAVPGAELLVLRNTGHDLPPERHDAFVEAIVRHTGARPDAR